MRFIIFAILCSITFWTLSQKKSVDHTVYNDWNSISGQTIADDGKHIVYTVKPHQGDGWLYIVNPELTKLDSIFKGESPIISGNSDYVAFKIDPGFDTVRNCELNKVDKKKWPKDSLGIWIFDADSLILISDVKAFSLNAESNWLFYTSENNEIKTPISTKKKKKKKKKTEKPELKSDGKVFHVLDPIDGKEYQYKNVTASKVSENANYVAFLTQYKKDKIDSVQLNILNTKTGTEHKIGSMGTSFKGLNFNKSESKLVYLYSTDTSNAKNYQLWELELGSMKASLILDTVSDYFPNTDAVSENYSPFYTENDKYLYFGVSEKNRREPKDTLLDKEKPKFDLWHYNDRVLQPQQLIELKRDLNQTDLYVLNMKTNKVIQLGNDSLNVRADRSGLSNILIAESNESYIRTYNWNYPHFSDVYSISLEDGTKKLIQRKSITTGDLSPSGNQLVLYNPDDRNMYYFNLKEDTKHCMTCNNSDVNWLMDLNGQPMESFPYAPIGWTRDEKEIWIKSEYDIWSFSTSELELNSISNNLGIDNKIRLSVNKWNSDSLYLDTENLYATGFDEITKGDHFYQLVNHGDHVDLKETAYFDANVSGLMCSKDRSKIIFNKQTFRDYPDLYTADFDFKNKVKISNANPQLTNYRWGTVELTKWTSKEGVELEGLIYKPDDFNSNEKYPMLIYYYELRSDNLHTHYIPKPTASIIYPGEYTSAGYVVFIPDIKYTPGYPARSAYDCIMSGTDHVLQLYPNIDSTRMGLQGQSWGGYQTAQMVTMTNRYKAAMAGAPVSNMFSAYGGIRWGSGMNRQFQYEHSQSRIGYTIWERPDLYIENSPLFHVPNIETPLLIMHNDDDGAVPWYQGIELFTAMRRLDKQVWMLTYNDDGHNLMKNANRIDLSIRMRQFFDHYLMEKPAPQWLTDGIPATLKGKELRY